MSRTYIRILASLLGLFLLTFSSSAEDKDMPLLFEESFEKGADDWQPSDAKGWSVKKTDQGQVYSQHKKQSDYKPPHRSPFNFSLRREVLAGDFVLTAKVHSTHDDYDHRDACLFFGYQDPAHFYYVHLGKKTDDHANQIFIVNGKPREKISTKTTPGTNWDEKWHEVKIVRRVADGSIEVYFDDMRTPIMTASDKTFVWGQVGVGSFDDTSDWDDIRLRGNKTSRPK